MADSLSEFRPSALARVMACPGSHLLSQKFPSTSGPAAEEGTRAHYLLQCCIEEGLPPAAFESLEDPVKDDGSTFAVTDDMRQAVFEALSYVWQHPEAAVYVETRVDASATLGEPEETLAGSADIIMLHPDGRLEVVDYKHGRRVRVRAADNWQLKAYLLGASVTFDATPIVDFSGTIIQPRAHDYDGEDRVDHTPHDLERYAEEIKEGIARARDPSAPRIPGEEQCRFCPARTGCRERVVQSLNAVVGRLAQLSEHSAALGPEDIADLLREKNTFRQVLDDVEEEGVRLAQSGKHVPGFDLVEGRTVPAWRDPEEALEVIRKMKLGDVKPKLDDIAPRTLLSPTRILSFPGITPRQEKKIRELLAEKNGRLKLAPAKQEKRTQTNPAELTFGSTQET